MISSLRKGSNRMYFVPSFNTPFNDCGKPNGFLRFIAGNFNILLGTPVISTLCSKPIRAMPTPTTTSGFRSGFLRFFFFFFLSHQIRTLLANIQNWSPCRINIQSLYRYLNRDCLNRPPEIHSNAKGTFEFPPCAVINSRRFDPRAWPIIITLGEV